MATIRPLQRAETLFECKTRFERKSGRMAILGETWLRYFGKSQKNGSGKVSFGHKHAIPRLKTGFWRSTRSFAARRDPVRVQKQVNYGFERKSGCCGRNRGNFVKINGKIPRMGVKIGKNTNIFT